MGRGYDVNIEGRYASLSRHIGLRVELRPVCIWRGAGGFFISMEVDYE
jgi:hypothetical protein